MRSVRAPRANLARVRFEEKNGRRDTVEPYCPCQGPVKPASHGVANRNAVTGVSGKRAGAGDTLLPYD